MKIMHIILVSSALSIVSCSHQPAPKMDRQVASLDNAVIFGLKDIDLNLFKEWTDGLYHTLGPNSTLDSKIKLTELITNLYQNSNTGEDFLKGILDLKINARYNDTNSYRRIAESLYSVRKSIRKNLNVSNQKTRESMLILNTLAEETLYVHSLLFSDKKNIQFDYANNTAFQCGKRSAKLDGVTICQGDILASKGGAASSSFISKISDYPGNFSHSTVPYITNGKIQLIEAEIDDGVKLRDPKNEYIDSKKFKLFIYRSKNVQTVKSAVNAVDTFVEELKNRIQSQDPSKVASYAYDFAMDAINEDKLFCSEIGLATYKRNSISAQDNPYPSHLWSEVTDETRKDFLSRFLDTKEKFPAPSDIELNPNYELISMHFDLNKIANDRYMLALIDTLFLVMNNNQDQVKNFLDTLGNLGSQIVSPDDIRKKLGLLRQLGIKIPDGVESKIDTVPQNINYKQLLFFSFINDQLAPKISLVLKAKESELLKSGHVLDLETSRIIIYKIIESEMQKMSSQIMKIMK